MLSTVLCEKPKILFHIKWQNSIFISIKSYSYSKYVKFFDRVKVVLVIHQSGIIELQLKRV